MKRHALIVFVCSVVSLTWITAGSAERIQLDLLSGGSRVTGDMYESLNYDFIGGVEAYYSIYPYLLVGGHAGYTEWGVEEMQDAC